MSQSDKESLSALLDNEADELELRRILKSCEQDPELLTTWERYNLVQSLLHESAIPVNPDLSKRIAAQLQSESLPVVPLSNRFSEWQKNLTKVAIAASVALVFVVVVQTNLENDLLPSQVQQSEQQADPIASTERQSAGIVVEDVAFEVDPVALQRLSEYIESINLLDEEEPIHTQHIQDSPLFRLVNELEAKP